MPGGARGGDVCSYLPSSLGPDGSTFPNPNRAGVRIILQSVAAADRRIAAGAHVHPVPGCRRYVIRAHLRPAEQIEQPIPSGC